MSHIPAIVAVFFLEAAAKILHRCAILCARRVGRKFRLVWADTKRECEKIRGKPLSEICTYTGACTLEKIATLPMFSRKSGLARAMVFLFLWASGLSLLMLILFSCFCCVFLRTMKLGARVYLSHARLPTVRPGSCLSCSGSGADRRVL